MIELLDSGGLPLYRTHVRVSYLECAYYREQHTLERAALQTREGESYEVDQRMGWTWQKLRRHGNGTEQII